MPEFAGQETSRDLGWIDLRARLARAAREMHFSALADESINSAALLAMAANLASLAISIPMSAAASGVAGGPVDASTLLAAQILQLCRPVDLRDFDGARFD